jgi:hypothetical protein
MHSRNSGHDLVTRRYVPSGPSALPLGQLLEDNWSMLKETGMLLSDVACELLSRPTDQDLYAK